jgi:two-component system, cell cycle response regulator
MPNTLLYSRRRSRSFEVVVDPPERVTEPWRRLLQAPDPLQVDAGAAGELLVARIRLWVASTLLLIPIFRLSGGAGIEAWVGLGVVLAAVFLALGVYLLVRRGFYRPWLGFATSALDVSVVSAGLAVWLVLGRPAEVITSRAVFEGYFLAIAATSLRCDPRICIATGLLAVAQYVAILVAAIVGWNLAGPGLSTLDSSFLIWQDQGARLILLVAAAILSTALVLRSQELRLLSRSDRLTGLPNRGYFDERVSVEIARARRYGHPLSIAMLDIDHFKQFNDSLGHAAGDIALRAVATTLRRLVRGGDLLVRYGGEEFLAVFPYLGGAGAVGRMDLIRLAISEIPLVVPGRPAAPGITISVGVAELGPDGSEVEDLLDRADARLYKAKGEGRNRVVGPGAEAIDPRRARPSA